MKLSGTRLRQLRLERFFTQEELARVAGTTEATVNRLEQGLQVARISTIRKLAKALDVPPAALTVDGEETKTPTWNETKSG